MGDTPSAADLGGAAAPGPFKPVDTAKRRHAALMYLAMAAAAVTITIATGISLLWLTAVAPLVLLATYQVLGGWKLNVSDMGSIATAGTHVSFPVGHGSATLGFRGFRARPVWQVLLFGDGPAPREQALVTIDAVSGQVTGVFEDTVMQP